MIVSFKVLKLIRKREISLACRVLDAEIRNAEARQGLEESSAKTFYKGVACGLRIAQDLLRDMALIGGDNDLRITDDAVMLADADYPFKKGGE